MKVIRTILLSTTTICAYALLVLQCVTISIYRNHSDSYDINGQIQTISDVIDILIVVIAVLVVINLLVAFIYGHYRKKRYAQKDAEQKRLGRAPFIFKIILTVYFIASFAMLVYLTIIGSLWTLFGLFVPFLLIPIFSGLMIGAFFVVVILIMLLLNYFLIMATSAYAIVDILQACSYLEIKPGLRILFGFLQFIPVADVISLPLIMKYLNRKSRESMGMALFA
jgi:magnesium-transporting ATPase (P-type)